MPGYAGLDLFSALIEWNDHEHELGLRRPDGLPRDLRPLVSEILKALAVALDQTQPSQRLQAVRIAGLVGEDAKTLVPRLRALQKKGADASLRLAIGEAMLRIAPAKTDVPIVVEHLIRISRFGEAEVPDTDPRAYAALLAHPVVRREALDRLEITARSAPALDSIGSFMGLLYLAEAVRYRADRGAELELAEDRRFFEECIVRATRAPIDPERMRILVPRLHSIRDEYLTSYTLEWMLSYRGSPISGFVPALFTLLAKSGRDPFGLLVRIPQLHPDDIPALVDIAGKVGYIDRGPRKGPTFFFVEVLKQISRLPERARPYLLRLEIPMQRWCTPELEVRELIARIGLDKSIVENLLARRGRLRRAEHCSTIMLLGAFDPIALPKFAASVEYMLLEFMQGKDFQDATAAAESLHRIYPQKFCTPATTLAVTKLDSWFAYPSVRIRAANLLGRLGACARQALPALRDALRDAHPSVRESAKRAIERIDRRP